MARLDLAAVMDGIAQSVKDAGVTDRVFGWPNDSAPVPCFVVGYPEPNDIEFDVTFGGANRTDKATIPAWFVVGRAVERTTRDALSAVITGADGIKEAIESGLTTPGGNAESPGESPAAPIVQTARVTTAEIEPVRLGGVDYLAVRFDTEVYA